MKIAVFHLFRYKTITNHAIANIFKNYYNTYFYVNLRQMRNDILYPGHNNKKTCFIWYTLLLRKCLFACGFQVEY